MIDEKSEIEGGIKFDQGKPRMGLLSTIWLRGVAAVLTFGAKKYDDHNWRKGFRQSRLIDGALRHIFAYNNGEDLDPESGLSHLDHASCCIMFARELLETHPHLDDRFKYKKLQCAKCKTRIESHADTYFDPSFQDSLCEDCYSAKNNIDAWKCTTCGAPKTSLSECYQFFNKFEMLCHACYAKRV